jgi:hypothetical protein
VPRNQEEHRENSARESYDEHRIVNAEPASLKFLAATFHELSTKSSCNATISATTTIVAIQSIQQPQPIREIFPPPPDSSSRLESKFKTSKLESLAIFRDNHANHRRVSHGIRN